MPSILLVAHAPLASTLLTVAQHTYADCAARVKAVDVPPQMSADDAVSCIAAALKTLPDADVLVMVDAFGATPCNAALAAVEGLSARVVTGVNVPMLWRTLCYAHLPLSELVTRAVDGARQGIMQVAGARRQDQPQRPLSDDPDPHSDQ